MSDTIHLQVVTYTDKALTAGIKELYIPAHNGEAGILEDHKPYISLLKAGEVFYTDVMDKKFYLYIREGFIEVIDNKASIICDSMEKAEDLDKEEIEKKLKQLDKRIKSSLKGEITPVELTDALKEQKEFEIKQDIILKMENEK
ncbi:MAG: ATP synthase F1 subunit epsilon [bacterium]|nr:ATP synthase F1 subunit epsilon [bacterium]